MSDVTESSESTSMVGATLGGKYKLVRLLGEGGMGAVYEATNANTGRRVAIKTLHAHLLAHASLRQRFLQEARAATQIEHPNVIDVLDLDIDAELGVPFIVQELLSGQTLAQRLDAAPSKRLAPEDALRIAAPVMGALVAAHNLGIVHRDLKPENIFLTRDRAGAEVPKVIDFGIAKVVVESESASSTRTGLMLGTPAYMSPEQAMGLTATIDAQTDVWAMGVVLYEMLSGRLPFEGENPNLTLGMIQYRDPVSLREREVSLDPGLLAVIDRALTKDREVRFRSMQAFLGALVETDVWTSNASPSLAPTERASSPSFTPPRVSHASPPPTPRPSVAPAQTLEAAVVARSPSTPSPSQDASASARARGNATWIAVIVGSLLVIAVVAGVALTQGNSSPGIATARAPEAAAPPSPVATIVAPRTSTLVAPPAPTPVAPPAPTPVAAPLAPSAPVVAPAPEVAAPTTHAAAVPVSPARSDRARGLATPPARAPLSAQAPVRSAPTRAQPAVRPATHTPAGGALNPDRDWQP